MILLMEERLHQLIGSLSHYLHDFIHPMWYLQVQNTDFSFCLKSVTSLVTIWSMNKNASFFPWNAGCLVRIPYFMIYDIILSYTVTAWLVFHPLSRTATAGPYCFHCSFDQVAFLTGSTPLSTLRKVQNHVRSQAWKLTRQLWWENGKMGIWWICVGMVYTKVAAYNTCYIYYICIQK